MERVARIHGTTILALRHNGKVVVAGDGQVSLGNTVMKRTARKVRRIYAGKVLAGFAGATADAFTLFDKFEKQLEQHSGNLRRAAARVLMKHTQLDAATIAAEAMHQAASICIYTNDELTIETL